MSIHLPFDNKRGQSWTKEIDIFSVFGLLFPLMIEGKVAPREKAISYSVISLDEEIR